MQSVNLAKKKKTFSLPARVPLKTNPDLNYLGSVLRSVQRNEEGVKKTAKTT